MTQQTNLPGKHNPLKENYYKYPSGLSPEMQTRWDAYWEKKKQTAPNEYRKHQREVEQANIRRISFEASLDDPDTIALYEHLTERWVANRLGALSDELALLGLEANATKREVRNAYRRKARKLHPDAGGDEAAFKQLHEAYRRVLAAAKA